MTLGYRLLEVTWFWDWKVKGQGHRVNNTTQWHCFHSHYSLGGDSDKSNTAWVRDLWVHSSCTGRSGACVGLSWKPQTCQFSQSVVMGLFNVDLIVLLASPSTITILLSWYPAISFFTTSLTTSLVRRSFFSSWLPTIIKLRMSTYSNAVRTCGAEIK